MAFIDVNGKRFKTFMSRLYGFGASIVILGALFKILHWDGADIMLMAGLGTEAVIFFFSAFEKPSEEVDWTLVYPELAGMDDPDMERLPSSNAQQQLAVSQQLDNMLSEAKIDGDLVQSLGDGMRRLSDTAGALGETVEAANATQAYSSQLGNAAKNMESLNALYAVQLENTNAQVNMQNNIMEKLGATAEDSEKLAGEIARLTQNIGSLNTVYGNMLSAMNIGGKA